MLRWNNFCSSIAETWRGKHSRWLMLIPNFSWTGPFCRKRLYCMT